MVQNLNGDCNLHLNDGFKLGTSQNHGLLDLKNGVALLLLHLTILCRFSFFSANQSCFYVLASVIAWYCIAKYDQNHSSVVINVLLNS